MKPPSTLEARFDLLWRLLHPEMSEPEREYRGIEGRRFLFDFAFPDAHVAIECQGGTWAKGRKQGHTRGSMYEKDCHKLCLASAQGWHCFWLTTTMLRDEPEKWLGLIAEAIEKREEAR